MKKLLLGLTVMALIFMAVGIAYAGSTAAQTFNVQINEINELSVSGDPSGMTITAGTAGSDPGQITDNSTTFSITTNGTSKKITGQITAGGNMPDSMFLTVTLTAPTTGTSKGWAGLATSVANDLVTGIATVADNTGNTIKYGLQAYASAGTMTQTSKIITLTLCAM